MKGAAIIAVLCLGLLAYASAECASACSGHGTCGTDDMCNCYPNWQAADCSERVCPFGLAFVDTPQGDLNHDSSVSDTGATGGVAVQWNVKNTWELYPTLTTGAYDALAQEAHFYVECSKKGMCNRETGMCECLDGYEGSSCQRSTCPNACSGHGVCRTVEEIAAASLTKRVEDRHHSYTVYSGVEENFDYNLWDADKNQACVCDPGYTGYDCSLRDCPRGDDPMTYDWTDCNGNDCGNAVQTLLLDCDTLECTSTVATLSFEDWSGKTWTTSAVTFDTTGGGDPVVPADIEAALEALPNAVFEDVTVTLSGASPTWFLAISFVDNSGPISPVTVDFGTNGNAGYEGNAWTAAVNYVRKDTITVAYGGNADAASAFTLSYAGRTLSASPFSINANPTPGTAADVRTLVSNFVNRLGFGSVTVLVTVVNTNDYQIDIYFPNSGDAAPYPTITDTGTATVTVTSTNTQGTNEESPCSNRGICDYETGVCKCFKGFFDDDCSQQNALAV